MKNKLNVLGDFLIEYLNGIYCGKEYRYFLFATELNDREGLAFISSNDHNKERLVEGMRGMADKIENGMAITSEKEGNA